MFCAFPHSVRDSLASAFIVMVPAAAEDEAIVAPRLSYLLYFTLVPDSFRPSLMLPVDIDNVHLSGYHSSHRFVSLRTFTHYLPVFPAL